MPAARYPEIADTLREKILKGEYRRGDRLPSEAKLAALLHTTTPTLRHALHVLQAEGLVHKRHGSGNYVALPLPRIPYSSDRRLWEEHPASEAKLRIVSEVNKVEACSELASLMNIAPGTQLTEYRYLSLEEKIPYSLVRLYVRQSMAKTLGMVKMPQPSPWGDDVAQLYAAYGFTIASTVERVVARPPTTEEGKALQIHVTLPVLAIQRVSTNPSGTVVEVANLTFRGDRGEAVYTTRPQEVDNAHYFIP
ncbi:GntR family transcriptional regulator [Streptomyces luteireticuli]|uniref:GntR family transcriptional regulator n=1 Tax=Streptomyces luteireticuli TaxID=173858 RepID=UPI003558320B